MEQKACSRHDPTGYTEFRSRYLARANRRHMTQEDLDQIRNLIGANNQVIEAQTRSLIGANNQVLFEAMRAIEEDLIVGADEAAPTIKSCSRPCALSKSTWTRASAGSATNSAAVWLTSSAASTTWKRVSRPSNSNSRVSANRSSPGNASTVKCRLPKPPSNAP